MTWLKRRLSELSAALLAAVILVIAVQQLVGVLLLSLCVGIVGFTSVYSVTVSALRRRHQSVAESVPSLIESIAASFDSGASLLEAFEYLALEFTGQDRLRAERIVAIFEADKAVDLKIAECKHVYACREADLFFEALLIAIRRGDADISKSLLALASRQRAQHGLSNELGSRQSWVLGSARLAQSSPWIIVILLGLRPETANAFTTPIGGLVLVLGLGLSFVAQRFIVAGARLPQATRNLGAVA